MHKLLVLACLSLVLCGCALSPRQRVMGAVVVTVIAVGAINAHHKDAAPTSEAPPWAPCKKQFDICI